MQSLITNKNPSLDTVMQHLSAVKDIKIIIEYYRLYFDVTLNCAFFKSYPWFDNGSIKPSHTKQTKRCSSLAVLADGSRKALTNVTTADEIVNIIEPDLSDLQLLKHFLSATGCIHPDITYWLHKSAGLTNKFMVIDRDYRAFYNDNRAYLDKVNADYQTMLKIFGEPNITVTSRGIESGLHFYYKLDKEYTTEQITHFAVGKMVNVGLEVKDGIWEIFPKTNTSMPPLPFGMNSKEVIKGVIQPELGLDALLKWYDNKPSNSLLSIIVQDKPIVANCSESNNITTHTPASLKNANGLTLKDYEKQIANLFQNPNHYKRQDAQHLLKIHTQIFLNLGLAESIAYAWGWLKANIASEDISKKPGWAYKNLVKYYSDRPLVSPNRKFNKLSLSLKQIIAILDELEARHNNILSFIGESIEPKKSLLFSIYSLYIHLHAECIRQRVVIPNFSVKTRVIKQWPGCSNLLYKKAMNALEAIGLVKVLNAPSYKNEEGDIRRHSNLVKLNKIQLYDSDQVIDLNKTNLNQIFLKYLNHETCKVMFGATGLQKRLRRK